jgi:signal transduction histidine kinase
MAATLWRRPAAVVGRRRDLHVRRRVDRAPPRIARAGDVRAARHDYGCAMRRVVPPGRDAGLAAAVIALALLETWLGDAGEPRWAYALTAVAMGAPLAWRRRAPLAVLAAVFVGPLALAAAGDELNAAYVMLVLILAAYSAGAHPDRGRARAGGALLVGLLATLAIVEPGVPVADYLFVGAILGAVYLLALALRDRGEQAGELARRAERLEREREEEARRAVADERARIARELHDIVAHSVSMVIVQTGAVRRRLREARPREAEELQGVETAARQALAEMRRLVGILRAEGDGPELAPQPGLGDLDDLVERVRRSGLPVDVRVEGERVALAPGVDLAAYRIVQEALTNSLRHAEAEQATVRLRFGERDLDLEVSDDGRGAAANGAGGGHGLVGMRERASLYGGDVSAGRGPDGGYTVTARLPIERA